MPIPEAVIRSIVRKRPIWNRDYADRAILLLGYHGKLTRSEVCSITVESIRKVLDGYEVVVEKGKACGHCPRAMELKISGYRTVLYKKHRLKTLCPVRALDEWLEWRRTDVPWLFYRLIEIKPEFAYGQLSCSQVNRTLERIFSSSGFRYEDYNPSEN